MKYLNRIITLSFLAAALISCSAAAVKPYSFNHFALGTVCSITLYEENRNFEPEDIFSVIDNIEGKMSPVIAGSEISRINSSAGKEPVEVSDETFLVISEGLKYSGFEGSKFDITIGPLVNLWGIGTEFQTLPSPEEIEKTVPLIDYRKIITDPVNSTVFLPEKKMAIDLGGIAKGYAADRVKEALLKEGFTRGIINLGGNVLTFGKKPDGSPWRIGVQDPDSSRGSYIGTLQLGEAAVVTSGIYERYFEKNGVRYHHILNPSTGYPVDNTLASISIVTDIGINADAYSTVIFSEGLENGLKLLESIPGTEGLFVTKDNDIYMTKGLRDSFTLTSDLFTVKELSTGPES